MKPALRAALFAGCGALAGLCSLVLFSRVTPHVPAASFLFEPRPSIVRAGTIIQQGFETIASPATRVLFVGDIMLDRNVARRSQEAHDLAYPFKKLPADWFNSFDYSVANLEGPVTDQRRPPDKTIDFQFDPAVIPVLKNEGIKAFSQANNHSLDQGSIGSADSHRRLQDAGFLVFGHEVEDGDVALATTTVNGAHFAFLGFNTTDNPLDEASALAVLGEARAQADHVIVFMHWGLEYHDRPEPEQRDRAHWFIDHGADAVIGSHPHWVQGIESYKNHPIVYSLGNFIFDQDFSTETRQGLAVALTFRSSEIDVQPIPVQIDLSQPEIVSGAEKTKRLESLADISEADLKDQILGGTVAFPNK